MSTEITVVKKPLSGLFTVLAIVLFLGGFYLAGSLFLASKAWYLRLFVAVLGTGLAIGVFAQTVYWQKTISLIRGARIEMNKVFWPSKDELIKTTAMVLGIVTVFAIVLSIIDWILTLIIQLVL